MAPRVVHLHIGSTKTGTTFIQNVLWSNVKALKENGTTLPASGQYAFGRAARALHNWRPTVEPVPADWATVAKAINKARTPSVLVSQEFLSWLGRRQAQAMVDSLDVDQVKVVLTTRDLARLIPAQWQSAIRQRRKWTLTEYGHSVQYGSDDDPKSTPYRHFWHRLDYAATIRIWSRVLGIENVTVVTVPPSGADPDELWRRFCAATDLDPGHYTTAGASNVSLGAASCEVMRRLNCLSVIQDMPREDYGVEINGTLTRRVLDLRGEPEPKLTLPEGQREWVMGKAEEVVAAVDATGVRVVGSTDELRPRPFTTPYQAPEDLPVDDLLAVALDALAGLAVAHSNGSTAPKPGFAQPRARKERKSTDREAQTA